MTKSFPLFPRLPLDQPRPAMLPIVVIEHQLPGRTRLRILKRRDDVLNVGDLLRKPLGVLNNILSERDHLADRQFSVAALNALTCSSLIRYDATESLAMAAGCNSID